jgi:cytochrome bd-type quinol oxidase subunit 1
VFIFQAEIEKKQLCNKAIKSQKKPFLKRLCTRNTATLLVTVVSWMHNPCSGHTDFSQIWGKASDWTVLYLNNLEQMKLFHWLIDN